MELAAFAGEHLDGVLRLCAAEGWRSLPNDPARALRVLTAPGVTTAVAVEHGEVLGFAQLLSDGEIQAFLANLAMDSDRRGSGIGRALVQFALQRAGGERVDLLSEPVSEAFYESFAHVRKGGFRIYPSAG